MSAKVYNFEGKYVGTVSRPERVMVPAKSTEAVTATAAIPTSTELGACMRPWGLAFRSTAQHGTAITPLIPPTPLCYQRTVRVGFNCLENNFETRIKIEATTLINLFNRQIKYTSTFRDTMPCLASNMGGEGETLALHGHTMG